MRLVPSLREVKGVNGFDNIGSALGSGIELHARQQLLKLQAESPTSLDPGSANLTCKIDARLAEERWWTRTWDSHGDVSVRLDSVMRDLAAHPSRSVIMIGHSTFFLELLRRYGSESFGGNAAGLELDKHKISNAACVAIDIAFDGDTRPRITKADMMFGSGAEKQHPGSA